MEDSQPSAGTQTQHRTDALIDPPTSPSARVTGLAAAYLETLYDNFKSDPDSVGGAWAEYFKSLSPAARASLEAEIGEHAGAAKSSVTLTPKAPARTDAKLEPLRGVAGKIVENMAASLEIPTATTFRTIPVKALEENRKLLNRILESRGKSKLTFTHLIGYALVRALEKHPAPNVSFESVDGAPHRRAPLGVNLGLAIDLPRHDGGRSLVVPNVKNADALGFIAFAAAVDEVIARARSGKLTPADFQATTITLTNPGTLGTVASVPRLMKGQGAIIAIGAIDYPGQAQAMAEDARVALGISKVMEITSTYDHRVIQGAESGAFLAYIHALLAGEHDYYKEIFQAYRIPFTPFVQEPDTKKPASSLDATKNGLERSARMQQFVDALRRHGHRFADLDPLAMETPAGHPELQFQNYGFTLWDLDREFYVGLQRADKIDYRDPYKVYPPLEFGTLRQVLDLLQRIYCDTIGYEIEHLPSPEERTWLRTQRIESIPKGGTITNEQKIQILRRLIEADAFEKFIHTRYVGQKRFSLEGGDALIPLLDILFREAARKNIAEAVIGMAHRGRLNVLANLAGMPLERIFAEFEGVGGSSGGSSGDVKYHLGFEGNYSTGSDRDLPISLACNPSHLEAVNPVVVGIARAKQDLRNDAGRTSVLPILIHGDAAFAGQGVVMETLQFSQLDGYKTGGTIHIIINNQIGYTANPRDTRSSLYCSDLVKTIDAPVFHVNGDDAIAVAHVAQLAFDYRRQFRHDVVIDLVCYRRHGHNEGDEPGFTQPVMYEIIEKHPATRTIFEQELVRDKTIAADFAKNYETEYIQKLAAARDAVKNKTWSPRHERIDVAPSEPATGVAREQLHSLGLAASAWPAGFTPHPKVERLFKKRRQMVDGADAPIDFGMGETLAYATLLAEGVPVRLSGEDSGRGTFSHRHSVLHDYKTGNRYIPLNHLAGAGLRLEGQGDYEVTDSLLSEEAVLGFEYGYSVERHHPKYQKNALVMWEAQFGNFVNGAQIQIDQFLAAGEAKWGQACGLVLLLPHGYDGQGPEHSSARLERFLQLCARDNMRIANPTTAAQFFHLLREQAYRRPLKPLVVMTPKSLLRAPEAYSPLAEFADARFRAVFDDPKLHFADPSAKACKRAILCSGKVYYDLAAERDRLGRADVAILRIERLYPVPAAELRPRLEAYGRAELYYVQEEAATMGAASFLHPRLEALAGRRVTVVSRPENPSPATGSARAHLEEQRAIIAEAFANL